ncbi:hypothetical protein BCR34DRAFT_624442 [Clohesyomyces aquaticus]|uniref:Uncharacterized protein n=1 Tax=Clohesyomyces aquaticus TaxID=1231657 RepID=A0A1Y1ZPW2_9PLEO|nr:hypothetical protein BCR34DRAFT_624442 [Clohesyomyces aquaticus]
MIGDEDDEDNFMSIDVEDHQQLKHIEDQIADLILCLDSTLDTVTTFMEMYEQFRNYRGSEISVETPSRKSAYGTDAVIFALKEKTTEIGYTRKKAEALLSKVQNTRTLISSLLERQSGHNINQQIAALQNLEKQAQEENATMRQLAEKNSRDSSSNFYSTQFVHQQESPSGATKIGYSTNWWLFFAISIPLTILTIFAWSLWVNFRNWMDYLIPKRTEGRSGRVRMFRQKVTLPELPK